MSFFWMAPFALNAVGSERGWQGITQETMDHGSFLDGPICSSHLLFVRGMPFVDDDWSRCRTARPGVETTTHPGGTPKKEAEHLPLFFERKASGDK